MSQYPDLAAAADQLIDAGQFLHRRGWLPATGGNFSARLADGSLAITASGCHKGELSSADILNCDLDGQPRASQRKTSYETPLHLALYRADPATGAVLHTHSVAATVLSMRCSEGVVLRGYELLKLLPGIATHAVEVRVPVFANDQDIPRLADAVEAYRRRHADMPSAYLIAGHGLYTWAANLPRCRWQVEALEFMFECELQGAMYQGTAVPAGRPA